MKFIYIILIFISTSLYAQDSVDDRIELLNSEMENAFNEGDLQKVADFYLDEAYLLNPGGKVITGRENINKYWTNIENPVKWELEVIEVTKDEKSIYENEYWIALKNKPPDWRVHGIEIENDKSLVYQLGNSKLTVAQNGQERTSEVNFILIWKYTEDGYKILLDTYSWE